MFFLFFFFNDTATTEIYTLSLHDALPIWCRQHERTEHPILIRAFRHDAVSHLFFLFVCDRLVATFTRSEEHTSELQSHLNLVCRLLLEKKKLQMNIHHAAAAPQSTDTSHT